MGHTCVVFHRVYLGEHCACGTNIVMKFDRFQFAFESKKNWGGCSVPRKRVPMAP